MKKPDTTEFMDNIAFPSARKFQNCMDGWEDSEKELAFNAYLDGYKACKKEVLDRMIVALVNAVENMDEHGEVFPHNYEEMKIALTKAGVQI